MTTIFYPIRVDSRFQFRLRFNAGRFNAVALEECRCSIDIGTSPSWSAPLAFVTSSDMSRPEGEANEVFRLAGRGRDAEGQAVEGGAAGQALVGEQQGVGFGVPADEIRGAFHHQG